MKCQLAGCTSEAVITCNWCLDMDDHPDDLARKKQLEDEGKEVKFVMRLIPAYRWKPEPQTCHLCDECAQELWLSCAGAVNHGYMNWRNWKFKDEEVK